MSFVYGHAVKEFLRTNTLQLPASTIPSYRFIGVSTREAIEAHRDAHDADHAEMTRLVAIATSQAAAAAMTAVRATEEVSSQPRRKRFSTELPRRAALDGAHMRAAAAYFHLSHLALRAAFLTQEMVNHLGDISDNNESGVNDSSNYPGAVLNVVTCLGRRNVMARDLLNAIDETFIIDEAAEHANNCREYAYTTIDLLGLTTQRLLLDGYETCTITEWRALCHMFDLAAQVLAAASSAMEKVYDMTVRAMRVNDDDE